MELKPKSSLYVITDARISAPRDDIEVVEKAIAGGAGLIQLREKGLSAKGLIALGFTLRNMTKRNEVLLIVNDRVDVAKVVKADGVHLGQEDMPVRFAREVLGEEKIIGVTIRNLDQAKRAAEEGASYVSVGPIYGSSVKSDIEPVGLELISQVKETIDLPVVAIGGINKDNVGEVIRAGADMVAVIRAVVGAADIEKATRELVEKINVCRGDERGRARDER